jgi:hypothetical protein
LTVTTAVARIDDGEGAQYFASLAVAVAAVPEKGTATITMLADEQLETYVTFPAGKTIKLDLAGRSVTRNGNCALDVYGAVELVDNGNEGGKLESGTPVWVNDGGAFTLTSGAVNAVGDAATGVLVEGTGTATLNGGSVTSAKWGVTVFNTATLTVDGATTITATDDAAIATNGTAGNDVNIVIRDGTITSENEVAIFQPSGTVTVFGGTITGATGIYTKSGSLTVEGGIITGNGNKADYEYTGDGWNATGDALVVDNCGYPGGEPTVSITGGTFISEKAQAVGSYAYGEREAKDGFISPEGTALFSDDVSDGVPAGYELVEAEGHDGLYEIKPLSGILYVTGQAADGKDRGVMMDVAWLKANGFIADETATQEELDGMQAALSETGDNGLPYWQSYVLGVDPKGDYPLVIAKSASEGGSYIITGKFSGSTGFNATPSENAKMTVKFTLVKRGEYDAEAEAWTWSAVASAASTDASTDSAPQFTVPMDDGANQVLAISVTIEIDDRQ